MRASKYALPLVPGYTAVTMLTNHAGFVIGILDDCRWPTMLVFQLPMMFSIALRPGVSCILPAIYENPYTHMHTHTHTHTHAHKSARARVSLSAKSDYISPKGQMHLFSTPEYRAPTLMQLHIAVAVARSKKYLFVRPILFNQNVVSASTGVTRGRGQGTQM